MSLRSARNRRLSGEYWPSFVDALTSLLLVLIFVLTFFVLAQFFLSNVLSGRDQALEELNRQVRELGELLSLERTANEDLRANVARLSANLQANTERLDAATTRAQQAESRFADLTAQLGKNEAQIDQLRARTGALQEAEADARQRVTELESDLAQSRTHAQETASDLAALRTRAAQLEDERKILIDDLSAEQRLSAESRDQVELLNQQVANLRAQLARLAAALDMAEAKEAAAQEKIEDLGRRLNIALAEKVEELSRYRSEFFGRLREVLGNRSDIRIVGDRFVFESELLFDLGSAEITPAGVEELEKLAAALKEITKEIPPDIDWILRVDGHTDQVPIRTAEFRSNWELSAARAIAVVNFLIDRGLPPERLAATGFGEYQPIDTSAAKLENPRNRRIEFKLTER